MLSMLISRERSGGGNDVRSIRSNKELAVADVVDPPCLAREKLPREKIMYPKYALREKEKIESAAVLNQRKELE